MRDDFARMHNEYLDPDRYFRNQEGGSAEFSIDLKWALWSADEGIWEQYAPEALKHLHMMSDNSLILHSAPRKEIRYGTVTITGTSECEDAAGELEARGRFEAQWDEPRDLMDTLGLDADDEDEYQCFVDCLSWANTDGDPGTYVEFHVKAHSVAELLEVIDRQEEELLKENDRLWKELEAAYKKQE